MFDAVHKRTNGVVSVLPNKNILFGSNKLGVVI